MTKERKASEEQLKVDVTSLSDPQEDLLVDPDTLDPDLHYRFGRDSKTRQSKLRAKGYRPVKRSDGVKLLSDDEAGAAEDLVRIGDMILMSCPKEQYERRQQRAKDLSNRRLENSDAKFRKRASLRQVLVIGKDRTDEG